MKLLARTLIAACALAAAVAHAAFPERPITLVVPYAPGGGADAAARLLATRMGARLGTSIIVDNRPGASGNTGTASVAKAAADGYTLVAVSSSMTTNAAVQAKMPFDPVKDLAPVAMFAKGPLVVAVNNQFPARTPQDLVRAIKASPGQFNYATSGTGSINHFATEMMRSMVPGMDIMHVPYKGQGPAVTDVIGNQVQMLVSSGPSILPMVRSGKLRAIGITSLKPSPIAPELIPMATAIPGYEFDLWWGLLAPAGTPQPVVARLSGALQEVMAQQEVKEALVAQGAMPLVTTPDEAREQIAQEVARWSAVIRESDIRPD